MTMLLVSDHASVVIKSIKYMEVQYIAMEYNTWTSRQIALLLKCHQLS